MTANAAELLRAYDRQLRGSVPDPLPNGWIVERDDPVIRFIGLGKRGWVLYRDLAGARGDALDALIEREIRAFDGRVERFEWKYHAHDLPADLPDRLLDHGFVPEDLETIEVGRVEQMAVPPAPPDGVALREVTDLADLARIEQLEATVWNEDYSGFAADLAAEVQADPTAITIVVAEAEDTVVSAGWLRYERGTEFATMWGGSTLVEWRGRGIYRSLVAHRANRAKERGFRYLETDASKDSRPILERLGFVPITTSTPYVWTPPSSTSS